MVLKPESTTSFTKFCLENETTRQTLFIRPTPSWLPPGRYTRSIAAKRWIVIIMQGCLLADSHKSTGSGPVRSPASCPSKKPNKHKAQPETKETKQTNKKQPKKHNHNQTKTNKTQRSGIATSIGNSCMMTSCVSLWEWPLTKRKTKKPQKNTRGQVRGCKKQQSSMRKPGIPPARIPEITESSRSGMTFTLALRSKHRQRRVATRVVRNEKPVRQEGETWSIVKMTALATALRAHSESAQ